MRIHLSISSIIILFGSCVLLSQSQLSEQIVSDIHTSASSSIRIWKGTLTTSSQKSNIYTSAKKLNNAQIQKAMYIQYYVTQKNQSHTQGVHKGQKRTTTQHASLIPVNDRTIVAPLRQTAPKPKKKSTSELLPVFNQKDIKEVHKQIANEAYKNLPKKCQNTLKTFYVRYDHPKNRGLAGPKSIILTGNVPNNEFRALFMHEIGHVFDLSTDPNCLGGTVDSGASEFRDGKTPVYKNDQSLDFYRISWEGAKVRKAGATDADFVSGYASWDVFEDFAESHAFFVLHNQKFRELATVNSALAAKYNFFVKHLYPNSIRISTSQHVNASKRPWDITKLPYAWHPVVVANR